MADSTRDLTNHALGVQRAASELQRAGILDERAFDSQLLAILAAKPGGPAALDLLNNFRSRVGAVSAVFPSLRRADVASELFDRLLRPSAIDQGDAGLCGPAALLFELAGNEPYRYVKFAVDLFDTGQATLGELEVKPNRSLREAPRPGGVSSLDWLTMASLRNSENLPIFTYASTDDLFSGITLPHEIERWLKALGYTRIENESDLFIPWNNSEKTIRKINDLFTSGARVFLFINSNLLHNSRHDQESKTADHWVMLMSKIDISNRVNVHFTVYTWGNPYRPVPEPGGKKSLELSMLLANFYGYVAGSH